MLADGSEATSTSVQAKPQALNGESENSGTFSLNGDQSDLSVLLDLDEGTEGEMPETIATDVHLKATLVIVPKNLLNQWSQICASWVSPEDKKCDLCSPGRAKK